MRICIVSIVFPPDQASTAHIVEHLAREFGMSGHVVRVVSTEPHYGSVTSGTRGAVSAIEADRAWMPKKTDNRAARAAAWAWFSVFATWRSVTPRADIVVVISPPLFACFGGIAAKFLRKSKFFFVSQEVLSAVLCEMQLVPRPVTSAIAVLERLVNRLADGVVFISPAMQRTAGRGIDPHKSHVIENFAFGVETEVPLGMIDQSGPVISYLGNMGPAQDFDTVRLALEQLQGTPWTAIFAGNGSRVGALKEDFRSIPSVKFHPPVELGAALAITRASTLGLVLQTAGTGASAMPSKVYQIMAAGTPVLAVVDSDSAIAELVRKAGAGFVVSPGAAPELVELLKHLLAHPEELREAGERGRAYCDQNASPRAAADRYLELFERST